ncbi:MAG: hypothetical protein COZ06_06965 [Armatimonadetes bacterium CG_4_10_14_3_um_filter_66_18]|nr:hypothetical protein [Armatimonadota bacterium]OIP08678.1 MAG: hypothetical protein AUJ96_05880 [Armatimonadetes bacterium CG2_30_66_41]PIU92381.1 MAG: hypothetical protein COS65_18235 [Armatimonadetes bacterium CG06_land_8_20_14_3_00_66_21]PIX38299.1 MAG: hypothetical protein COZ57_30925 [Armatimonadetes bacterium CG_4_8_14_3_um_filter_66_20]PIY50889.1 MAG: hypothetical protein COZ06_06965 [Armatimonadetes bacterium CG_4_10_14_3_um_filter_66_18]PIZ47125.1 MAG: hypothetical protein COY42_09
MLIELSPYVRRQAQRLCRFSPSLVEDAYSEGRLRVWELLQTGIQDEAYLLKSSANRIRNFLAHESYEPKPLDGQKADAEGRADPLEALPDAAQHYEEVLSRAWLGTLQETLRSALEKELFTREAKTDAERVALHRFRRSQSARELATGLSLA